MDSILIKTLAAVILGFVISAVLGKYLVPALRRWKAGQAIKEDGPTWHMSKQGTPTMGGLMFIAAVAIVVLVLNGPAILSGDLTSVFVLLFALVFGLIGFIDDYAKIKKKENTGLSASQKFLLQLAAKKAHTGRVTELESPSTPSVMFTAFTVPVMTRAAKIMYTTQGSFHSTPKKGT